MDSSGLCDNCGKTGAMNTCMLCGKRVCTNCYVLNKKVCKDCLSGKKIPENFK